MRARDVMTTDVQTVSPDTTVLEAARLMLEKRISGAPVVDRAGRLLGIICEGDLMRRAELGPASARGEPGSPEKQAAAYVKAHALSVADVMTRDVVTIDEHEPLDRIALLFEERRIKASRWWRTTRSWELSAAPICCGRLPATESPTLARTTRRSGRPSWRRRRTTRASARRSSASPSQTVSCISRGDVASDAESDAVRVVADTTEGVHEVHNHIRILPHSVLEWDFEWLAFTVT